MRKRHNLSLKQNKKTSKRSKQNIGLNRLPIAKTKQKKSFILLCKTKVVVEESKKINKQKV